MMNSEVKADYRVFSKQGRTVECLIGRLPLCTEALPGMASIEHCYRQAEESFLVWLKKERLPALCAAEQQDRKGRLHRLPEVWHFEVQSSKTENWLSILLRVSVTSSETGGKSSLCFEQRRVWDANTGALCPITTFLPYFTARKYKKWAYSLENDQILAIERRKNALKLCKK